MSVNYPYIESESEDGNLSGHKKKLLEKESEDNAEGRGGNDPDTVINDLSELLQNSGKNNTNTQESEDKKTKHSGEASHERGGSPSAANYTLEQRNEITRIQKCSQTDYYRILNLKRDCSQREVKKAYMKLARLAHTDNNKFQDAKTAFQLISTAYQVLSDPTERAKYDKRPKKYKLNGELDAGVIWDEVFAPNAGGSESEDDSNKDESDEEEEKPSSSTIEIYKTATPWVHKILANPHDKESKSQIEDLNKKIAKSIKQDNKKRKDKKAIREGAYNIQLRVLRSISIAVQTATLALEKEPSDKKAKEDLKANAEQLKRTIRINSYPEDWYPQAWASFLEMSKTNDNEGDIVMDRTDQNTEHDEEVKDNEEDTPMATSDVSYRHTWEPGQTRKGEKILGWRPFYRVDRKTRQQVFTGCQFVIEKKGPNPIALISGQDAGRRVVDAYRDLPEEQQNDIRYSEQRYTDQDSINIGDIIGFASGAGDEYSYRRPNSYALYSFADGSERLLSRSAVHKVLGRGDGENEIQEFLDKIGETPPKRKRLISGAELKRRRRSTYYSDDDDTDTELETSHRVLNRKQRPRNYDSSGTESSSDDGAAEKQKPRPKSLGKKSTRAIEPNYQNDLLLKLLREVKKSNTRTDRMLETFATMQIKQSPSEP